MAEEFLTYKGFPLVRNGRTIYYGNMSDEFVANLNIVEAHDENGIEVASKIKMVLMRTDPTVDVQDMVVKTSERESLYDALDVANIWLSRSE